MIAASAPPVPALIAAARRRIVRHFQDQGATVPSKAVGYEGSRRIERSEFKRLLKRGVIIETSVGRYYLDPKAYEDFRRKMRGKVAVALGVAVAGALWAMMA